MYYLLVVSVLLLATNVHGINKITCQDSTMEIICTGNDVINITSANYGRTSPTPCSNPGPVTDTNCSAEDVLEIVNLKCQGEQTCLIEPGRCLFGDPCYNTYKYLEVNYECIPDPKYKYATTCAHTDVTLSCPANTEIKIIEANYGRETYSICDDGPIVTAYCLNKQSTQIAANLCNDKETCVLSAEPEVFGDPCEGTFKYLSVKYECRPDYLCPVNGQYISYSKLCDGGCDCPVFFITQICLDETTCPLPQ